MKPDAKTISGAIAAESALAREEADGLEQAVNSLPDDHPLKTEVARQKQLIGDLAGLPPGHPLLVELEEARLRFEAEHRAEAEVSEVDVEAEKAKLRRAKRLDAKKAKAEQWRKEEEREQLLRTAAKRINESMSETIDSMKRLNDNIAASAEDFNGDRYTQMKLARLNRLLVAAMRGVSESKLNVGRVASHG